MVRENLGNFASTKKILNSTLKSAKIPEILFDLLQCLNVDKSTDFYSFLAKHDP